ncbi:MAG: amidohydrolase family protein [Gemmatimonadetes bacterium]|nr:amidohydrolase family protein [Gemmatimonadota bacterium]
MTSPPIAQGAVLVDSGGRIAAVGPAAAVPAPDGAERIDLGQAALLPGLVNVHAHPELTAFRGLLEDLPFQEWIAALMAVKRAAALTPEEYGVAARWSCIEALAAGITTLAATEESGAAFDALREAGMRGVVYREVFGPAPAQAEDSLADLRARVESMRARETELVRVGISPHAVYTVSDSLFRVAVEYALAESLPVAVHAAEAEAEERLVQEGAGPFATGLRARGIDTPPRGSSTIVLLDRLSVLRTRPLLIHGVRVDGGDVTRIAASGATVAHCPAANTRLGHGIAPVPEMLAAGIAVGLGSDSAASNNRMDLLEEARLAQMLQRARLGSATALPADQLLRLATLDGARALGLDGRIGSLEPGKDADLCAISLAGAHVTPVHEPLAALFYAARAPDVALTVVRGRVLYRDGVVIPLDVQALQGAVAAAAAKLRAARA